MSTSRMMVLAPGRWGGDSAPWMMYSSEAGARRGSERRSVVWDISPDLYLADTAAAVRAQVAAVLDSVNGHESLVLVGKSLGTFATPIAAKRAIPAVWHTPLLRLDGKPNDEVLDGLRDASAPFLLTGGTADASWDGELARSLTPHVLELDGADHGYLIADAPLAHSLDVMGKVATAVEHFLDTIVWP